MMIQSLRGYVDICDTLTPHNPESMEIAEMSTSLDVDWHFTSKLDQAAPSANVH